MRGGDLVCAIAAVVVFHVVAPDIAAQPRPAPAAPATLRTDAIARVARLRASAVVAVHTRSRTLGGWGRWLDRSESEGLASGVVIEAGGLILTNAHVIEGAQGIHVRTPDGDDVPVTLVGIDPEVDLALLQATDPTGLRPAPFGDSDRLQVGEWVVAIGNPLGLHHTVTAGIISAKARTIDDSGVEYLQTDAAISPGNSGGPVGSRWTHHWNQRGHALHRWPECRIEPGDSRQGGNGDAAAAEGRRRCIRLAGCDGGAAQRARRARSAAGRWLGRHRCDGGRSGGPSRTPRG